MDENDFDPDIQNLIDNEDLGNMINNWVGHVAGDLLEHVSHEILTRNKIRVPCVYFCK